MTQHFRDAQQLSAVERKAELSALFAMAFLRLRARNPCLALDRLSEPSCAPVDAPEKHRASTAPSIRTEAACKR